MLLCWNCEIGSKDSHIRKMLSFLPSLVEGLGCYIWEWVTQGLCWKAVIPGILFPARSTDFALGMRSRDSLGWRSFWQWEWSNEGWTENSKLFINSLCYGIVMHGLECLDRDPEKSFCLFFWVMPRQWASLRAQLVRNPPAMQETPVWFLSREDPLENR